MCEYVYVAKETPISRALQKSIDTGHASLIRHV